MAKRSRGKKQGQGEGEQDLRPLAQRVGALHAEEQEARRRERRAREECFRAEWEEYEAVLDRLRAELPRVAARLEPEWRAVRRRPEWRVLMKAARQLAELDELASGIPRFPSLPPLRLWEGLDGRARFPDEGPHGGSIDSRKEHVWVFGERLELHWREPVKFLGMRRGVLGRFRSLEQVARLDPRGDYNQVTHLMIGEARNRALDRLRIRAALALCAERLFAELGAGRVLDRVAEQLQAMATKKEEEARRRPPRLFQ